MIKQLVGPAAILAFAAAAQAQSAGVTLSGPTSAVPGDLVSVAVSADFDLSGAGAGVFGAAGFYGFGGNVLASGPAAAGAAASVPAIDPALAFGSTATNAGGAFLVRAAAGRGFAGGIDPGPSGMMTFDVTIPAGAAPGDVLTLDYAGAVVLVLGDQLATFSTDPGVNQNPLTVTPLVITVAGGGCNQADLAEPFGILDLTDVTTFVSGFTTFNPVADIDGNGIFDLTDVTLFVGSFTAGCP